MANSVMYALYTSTFFDIDIRIFILAISYDEKNMNFLYLNHKTESSEQHNKLGFKSIWLTENLVRSYSGREQF